MTRFHLKNDYFFLALIYLLYLYFAMSVFSWVIDDLYIYFRYVNNFTNGKGIVYNPGEFVEGFSSFGWFLILSLFKFLNLPLELSSKISGLIFAFLNLIVLYKICILLNLGRKMSLVACSLMMFNLPFILWSISGFEIMFYILIILFCFYRVMSLKINTSEVIALSILIFLISLSRPEGVMFSFAFLVFIYVISRNYVFTFKVFFLYGVLFGSFLCFRYFYFDDIVPNTFYAKIGHNILGYYEIRTYKNGVFYILDFFRYNPQFSLILILVPVIFGNLKSNKVFLFTLCLILIQFFFVIFSGGDWMVQYRFIVPAISLLSIALAVSLKEFIASFKIKKTLAYSMILLILIINGSSLVFADFKIINIETKLWNNLKYYSEDIKNTIPSKSLVANGSSGIIPYTLRDVEFLDIVGLTNRHIARNGFRHGTWFEKSLPDYVYSKNPDWIIMWKKKKEDNVYKFENASPCYVDMAQNINFNKYSLNKIYDVYEDVKVELYKLSDTAKMKIFFLGRYNQSEFLSGPEKVAKRIYAESVKKNESFFIEYFFDGGEYGFNKKLFGSETLNVENNLKIMRLGIVALFFLLLKEKPAIVHIITYERFAAAAFLYKVIRKVKIVYNVHGIIYHENINYKTVSRNYILKDRIFENIVLKYSDKIIFLSNESVEIAAKYFKLDRNRIEILPNGIDEIFSKTGEGKTFNCDDPLKIVFIGDTGRKEKGFEFLYRALTQINFLYDIYCLCNDTEFKENNFTGVKKMNTCEYAEFLTDKDIYISASEYEPFSISAVEAMASGLVPIVTEKTGMSRFIEQGESGFVFESGDSEQVIEIIKLLNSERDMILKISQNAKLIYNNLNWTNVFTKYKNIYYKLINS